MSAMPRPWFGFTAQLCPQLDSKRLDVKYVSAPERSSSSLSNGARNRVGELREYFAMMHFLFWSVTIGSCAAWTAIGYVLARLM